jgi:hypothetical protein
MIQIEVTVTIEIEIGIVNLKIIYGLQLCKSGRHYAKKWTLRKKNLNSGYFNLKESTFTKIHRLSSIGN